MASQLSCRSSFGSLGRAVILSCLALGAFSGCAVDNGATDAQLSTRYQAVIANPIRTDADRQQDPNRHPQEFLSFTRVAPGMRVLDVAAGAGYTSELLALAVGDSGVVFAQTQKPGAALVQRMSDHPQPNLVVVTRSFDDPVPPQAVQLDLITIIMNYHDITYLPVDRAKMNARLFAALKSGGHLVIVDHSARPGTGISEGKTLHRIEESVVREELGAAGFKLEAQSDFLRNPADARDQISAGGPVVSDKFALRFVKP